MSETWLKKLPALLADTGAECFVGEAGLSEYALPDCKPMRCALAPAEGRVNMRVPRGLLVAVKSQAKRPDWPYQRYLHVALEHAVEGYMNSTG